MFFSPWQQNVLYQPYVFTTQPYVFTASVGDSGPGSRAGDPAPQAESPAGSSSPGADSLGGETAGYHIRQRDLKQIHKAACAGDVKRVKLIRLFSKNDVDAKDRKGR